MNTRLCVFQENEPTAVDKFEEKKQTEISQLQSIKVRTLCALFCWLVTVLHYGSITRVAARVNLAVRR